MKTKAKKVSKKPVNTPYKATAIIAGRKYEASGSSIPDAISKLEAGRVKSKCVLVIEKDDYRKERILQPMIAYRLFNSMGMTKEIALKNASLLF